MSSDTAAPPPLPLPAGSRRYIGVLCGALLLLTVLLPWKMDIDGIAWSWSFFKPNISKTFKIMLIGAWLAGFALIIASYTLSGVKRAVVYLCAGALVLTLAALQARAPLDSFTSFLPLAQGLNRWIPPLLLLALAIVLVQTALALTESGQRAASTGRVAALAVVAILIWQAASVLIWGASAVALPPVLIGSSVLLVTGAAMLISPVSSTGVWKTAGIGRGIILAGLLTAGFGSALYLWINQGAAFPFATVNKELIAAAAALAFLEACTGLGVLARKLVCASGAALLIGLCAFAPKPPESHFAASAAPQNFTPVQSVPIIRKGNWSQWCGGLDRNMVSDETNLATEFDSVKTGDKTALKNVRWVVPLGRRTLGSPVVANGKVYVGGALTENGEDIAMLWCFNIADGALLWRMHSPYIKMLYNADSFGTCSTPTLDGDHLYMLNHLGDVLCLSADGMAGGNKGVFKDEANYFASGRERTKLEIAPDGQRIVEVSAGKPAVLTPQDADILWRYDLIHEVNCWPFNALNSAVIVRGENLYISTCTVYSKVSFGKESSKIPIDEWKAKTGRSTYDSPSLIVLDKHTGKLLARDREGIFDSTFHGQNSSPALGVLGGREQLVYGAGNGYCYGFDPYFTPATNGQPGTLNAIWKFNCVPEGVARAEVIGSPVLYKNRVYASIGNDLSQSGPSAGPGRLVCIDATRTGDITNSGLIWSYDSIRSSSSTVAIADGLLYTGDAASNIYCFDADTGKLHWRHKAAGPIWGSPFIADEKVYVGQHSRGQLVFAHAKEKKILAENLPHEDIVASPAVVDGVMYIATQTHLYAVEKGKTGALKGEAQEQEVKENPRETR